MVLSIKSKREEPNILRLSECKPQQLQSAWLTVCGMRLLEPKPPNQKQVMGGGHALPGIWPWLISIQIYTPRGPRHSCDGALVDARWILTAAHCFSAKRDSLKSWKIVLGATDLSKLPDVAQLRSIKRVIFHQDYNPLTAINDIALIELDNPVIFDDYVQPICLPPITMDPQAFSDCYINSWSSEGISAFVYGARANILETTTCNGSKWHKGGMNPHTLCANLEDRDSHSCQGTFGGLLTCKTSPKSPYYIVGISNFEKDCAKTKEPIIYTSIQRFLEWIATKMVGTENTLQEKHLQNRNIEDSNSASLTDLNKETTIKEPPYVPQERAPIIPEPPYVPDETTPLPPVSPFIPRETPSVAVDKSSPSRLKRTHRSKYRFSKTVTLPPQYVPLQAKVTLEPQYTPLKTLAFLQQPYVPPEPSFHLEPPFILPETPVSLEPPYTLHETTRSLEPPYIPLETTASLEPPYILQESTSSLEPPYTPTENYVVLENPFMPTGIYATLEPPYVQGKTPPSLEAPHTSGISTTLEPPNKSPKTMLLEPSY